MAQIICPGCLKAYEVSSTALSQDLDSKGQRHLKCLSCKHQFQIKPERQNKGQKQNEQASDQLTIEKIQSQVIEPLGFPKLLTKQEAPAATGPHERIEQLAKSLERLEQDRSNHKFEEALNKPSVQSSAKSGSKPVNRLLLLSLAVSAALLGYAFALHNSDWFNDLQIPW